MKNLKPFFYFLSFQPISFNQYLSNVKGLFGDNSRAEPTTFSTDKKHTVSHFSYAPLFQGPYFLKKNAGIEHSL